MPSKRQLRAARQREENQRNREREAAELKTNAARLKTMTLGLSLQATTTGRVSAKSPHASNTPKSKAISDVSRAFHRATPDIPSHTTTGQFTSGKKRYVAPNSEMAEREQQAQKEIDRKKQQVGVLVNKSGYQYITPGMDLATLGKK